MTRFERTLVTALSLTAVGLWAMVIFEFNQAWQKPLGPQLALPTDAASSTPRPLATSTLISGQTTLTPKGQLPLCGGPPKMTLLAVGSDTREGGYLYGLADVIRLVRVDFKIPRVTALEFPRDLWVEIPDIESHYQITHGKLNEAYFYGNKGMGYYKGPGEGPGLLARALDLNFGARADHYIAGNMWTFVRAIDTLGGIDVTLPRNVDGRKPDQPKRMDLFFKAGTRHLNGQQTLMLSRIRQNTVFERVEQQNWVLCGVRNALLSPQNLPKIPQLINDFDNAIQTDLSPQQIGQLACLLPALSPKNISFVSFPTNLLTATRTYDIGVKKDVFIWAADFNTLRLYVSAFDSGTWPAPAPLTGESAPPPANISSDHTSFSCK